MFTVGLVITNIAMSSVHSFSQTVDTLVKSLTTLTGEVTKLKEHQLLLYQQNAVSSTTPSTLQLSISKVLIYFFLYSSLPRNWQPE